MSGVKLEGNALGTGVFTIKSPNSNTDRTFDLPDAAGTMMVSGNMPAFSAYASATTSMSANVYTKIQLQTKEFDTNSNFDNTTNYRFTPTVAGYYQVNGCWYAGTNFTFGNATIYKNGASIKAGNSAGFSSNNANGFSVSALVYLNGSTDYIELYGQSSVANTAAAGVVLTYLQAFLVRSA